MSNLNNIDPVAFNRAKEVAKRKALCRKSVLAFIDLCVKIEDLDSPSAETKFHLWPEQIKALQTFETDKLNIVLKARQLGLTWLALCYVLWRMIFNVGYTVVGLSRGEDEAKEMVRRLRFMLERMPKWLIRHYKDKPTDWEGLVWEDQILNLKIHHPSGAPSRFLADAANKDSGRSFTANVVIVDEWAIQPWAYDIWQAAYPVVNRPTGGQVIGISTAKPGTLFHDVWKGAPKNGFTRTFLPWSSDPRRDRAWYDATKAALPRTYRAEYPSTAEEAFSVGVDRFFTSFDPSLHTYDPEEVEIPDDWFRFRMMDWGYSSPFCILWAAVDYDGRMWVYRELYDKQQTASQVAGTILEIEDAFEEVVEYSVGDHVWDRRGSSAPTVGEEFAKSGIVWDRADKNRIQGWNQVHLRLEPTAPDQYPALMISKKCHNLITQMIEILQAKNNPEDLDTKMEDHAVDALRYGLQSRPLTPIQRQGRDVLKRIRSYDKGVSWMSY
jgi:hypothetical protein